MSGALSLIVPGLLSAVGLFAMIKRVNVFSALTAGAADGLRLLVRLAPTLIVLLTAISMLRASGALDGAVYALTPLFERLGIPPECVPLTLLRPVSGSGALAVGADLIRTYGPDSYVGRVTAVMLGCTETTFYTIGVYFGAAGISKGRYVLVSALIADCAGFFFSALAVRLFMGGT